MITELLWVEVSNVVIFAMFFLSNLKTEENLIYNYNSLAKWIIGLWLNHA